MLTWICYCITDSCGLHWYRVYCDVEPLALTSCEGVALWAMRAVLLIDWEEAFSEVSPKSQTEVRCFLRGCGRRGIGSQSVAVVSFGVDRGG